jgi:hypothetical protein
MNTRSDINWSTYYFHITQLVCIILQIIHVLQIKFVKYIANLDICVLLKRKFKGTDKFASKLFKIKTQLKFILLLDLS